MVEAEHTGTRDDTVAAVPLGHPPRVAVAEAHPDDLHLHDPVHLTGHVALSPTLYMSLLLLASGAGAIVRVLPLIGSSFPVGDGGLFWAMVRELRSNGFALPHLVSYNGEHFPYAYPPLAFYLAAGLWTVTGANLETIFRVFPLVFSLASIGAFILLARAILPSRMAVVGATFAFALLPNTFYWQIKGGGLTRSPGLFFALLALQQSILMYQRREKKHVALAIVFCGLMVLTHLEWTLFVVTGIVVFWFMYDRSRGGLVRSAVLVLGTAAVAAPWWITLALRHDLPSLIGTASGTSQAFGWMWVILNLFLLKITDELGFPSILALALAGLAVTLSQRPRILPVWLAITFAVTPRGSFDKASVILALLAGIGVETALATALPRAAACGPALRSRSSRTIPIVLLSLLAFQATAASAISVSVRDTSLSPQELQAMHWVHSHTPAGSTFLVVSPITWSFDDNAEWFPVLADRVSVTTVQGTEWLRGAFARRSLQADNIHACLTRSTTCMTHWIHKPSVHVDYVYIAKSPPESDGLNTSTSAVVDIRPVVSAFAGSKAYVRVFDNVRVAIFRHVSR